jgi:hypothetical protein
MTDYKALCAELADALHGHTSLYEGHECELVTRARAALPQPEPEGPTASDVTELFYRHMGEGSEVGFENAIAEALTRWARPTIEPVPVAERPWEREGWCDAEGRCWWGRVEGNPGNPEWFLAGLSEIEGFYEIGDWIVLLPHHALPVPCAEVG